MSDDTVKTMNSLQKARENKVVKSSEMVQKGKFYLSLMESKALNYLVSKIKPGDDINTEYCFNCNEFQSIIHRSIVSEKIHIQIQSLHCRASLIKDGGLDLRMVKRPMYIGLM